MVNSGQRPDAGSDSLREFAYTIQEKAGLPLDTHSETDSGQAGPAHSTGRQALQTSMKERVHILMTGLAAGTGLLVGYLFGRNRR